MPQSLQAQTYAPHVIPYTLRMIVSLPLIAGLFMSASVIDSRDASKPRSCSLIQRRRRSTHVREVCTSISDTSFSVVHACPSYSIVAFSALQDRSHVSTLRSQNRLYD